MNYVYNTYSEELETLLPIFSVIFLHKQSVCAKISLEVYFYYSNNVNAYSEVYANGKDKYSSNWDAKRREEYNR